MNQSRVNFADPAAFPHPEPDRPRVRILPVFLPFAACPSRCVFCDQKAVTGKAPAPLSEIYADLERDLEARAAKADAKAAPLAGERGHNIEGPVLEIAFYGGTFSALPRPWPRRFLELAARYKESGLITRIRCSTRPDCLDQGLAVELAGMGLDMVEFGVQSFDPAALVASRRGYGPEAVVSGCRAVRGAGMDLGIQLMPGLPGSGPGTLARDAALAAALKPSVVRLYPCLVLAGSPLAEIWRRGEYRPWDLDRAVEEVGDAVHVLWREGIVVSRIGLAPEAGLEDQVLAGPGHPAMGQLVRSRALFLHVREMAVRMEPAPTVLRVPKRFWSDVVGHKRSMLGEWSKIGLTPVAGDGELFVLD